MIEEKKFSSAFAGQDIGYMHYRPEGAAKAPVFIFLHGLGWRYDGQVGGIWYDRLLRSCWPIQQLFTESELIDYRKRYEKNSAALAVLPEKAKKQDFDTAFWYVPQLPVKMKNISGDRSSWDKELLIELYEQVIAKNPQADLARVYLIGESMGGGGVWRMLASKPEWFAAGVPICGTNPVAFTAIAAAKDVAIWAFHNTGDPTVLVKNTENFMAELRKANAKEAKVTYFTVNNHDTWNLVYGLKTAKVTADSQQYEPGTIWKWMLSKSKNGPVTPEPKPEQPATGGIQEFSGIVTDSAGVRYQFTVKKLD